MLLWLLRVRVRIVKMLLKINWGHLHQKDNHKKHNNLKIKCKRKRSKAVWAISSKSSSNLTWWAWWVQWWTTQWFRKWWTTPTSCVKHSKWWVEATWTCRAWNRWWVRTRQCRIWWKTLPSSSRRWGCLETLRTRQWLIWWPSKTQAWSIWSLSWILWAESMICILAHRQFLPTSSSNSSCLASSCYLWLVTLVDNHY